MTCIKWYENMTPTVDFFFQSGGKAMRGIEHRISLREAHNINVIGEFHGLGEKQ